MAENSADRIVWLLELRREHIEWLAGIRHWQHLKVATDEGSIWVSGFRDEEVNDVAVRSIPVKNVWYQKDNLLFAQGSIVPSRKAGFSLLWTPIDRGLPVRLPAENNNFFGVPHKIGISLVPSDAEQPAFAMVISLKQLKTYIEQAPAIRLKGLGWTITEGNTALIFGTPLLPIPGSVLWRRGNFLLPSGYDFEWAALAETLQSMLASEEPSYILWHTNAEWSRIPGRSIRPLTIGSFRQSTSRMADLISDSTS